MEMKFRVADFEGVKDYLLQKRAKPVSKHTDHYIYLNSGNKLTYSDGLYFFVVIKKKGKCFLLKKQIISRKAFETLKIKYGVKKTIKNRQEIYNTDKIILSLNTMKIGNFIILDGNKNNITKTAKALGLKNPITKPFSEV